MDTFQKQILPKGILMVIANKFLFYTFSIKMKHFYCTKFKNYKKILEQENIFFTL